MANDITLGLVAGLEATVPMTIFMEAGRRILPEREQYALPPREIIEEGTRKIGVSAELDDNEKTGLTLVSHFAYGSAMGGIYGAVIRPYVPVRHRIAAGLGWGLSVWTASYLGILPALGILSPATRHPARRNALMIAAHVIWGITLAGCLEKHRNSRSLDRKPKRRSKGGKDD